MEKKKTIYGRTVYIPQMSFEGAKCMAAAFHSVGINARPSPPGDIHTYDLARRYLSGDECLPEAVTLGNFLKITQQPGYDPAKTALFLPTSNGPCRFGHYYPLAKKIFEDRGEDDVMILTTSSSTGYEDIGKRAKDFVRTAWRAVVISDILRKLLLKTRPYEANKGEADMVFSQSLNWVCQVLSIPIAEISHRVRMQRLQEVLVNIRQAFAGIERDASKKPLLIGIVGEIFCRLNDFSNENLVRIIEMHGGEVWMSDVSEWIFYTRDEEILGYIEHGRRFSFSMLGAQIKLAIMRSDEHKILSVFKDDLQGYEEPSNIRRFLNKTRPYLPREGARGEMVLNAARALWYYEKGAAGVVDISPFTCMNGIVCESVYPRISRDFEHFPIRVFYFDGIHSNIESDVEIFLELARNFANKKARRSTEG
ncbi:hypothetical protein JW935_25700 [candidate division KSB1 bacterium]|nr:hypothetical protein [candidate division KSB1 bacterium]